MKRIIIILFISIFTSLVGRAQVQLLVKFNHPDLDNFGDSDSVTPGYSSGQGWNKVKEFSSGMMSPLKIEKSQISSGDAILERVYFTMTINRVYTRLMEKLAQGEELGEVEFVFLDSSGRLSRRTIYKMTFLQNITFGSEDIQDAIQVELAYGAVKREYYEITNAGNTKVSEMSWNQIENNASF